MVGPYRTLFSMPGAKGFVIAGFVGRAPMAMLGIGIVLLISALTGSYTTAGAVSATTAVAFAIAAPLSGRLIDRFGQARILIPLALVHGAALTGLMLCAEFGAPRWTLFAFALVTGGAATSLGSMVRARWSHLLSGRAGLHTAFSFESVADEVIFVAGPALTAGLAAAVSPYAGLVVAGVCAVAGTVAFALQRGTEPPVRTGPARSGSPITIPAVALLAGVFLAMGAVFGSVDLITVAFAAERGAKAAAGLLLGCVAFGSMLSGLWYGHREWALSLRRRFAWALVVFAVGFAPIAAISDLRLMAVALFFAGLAISPTIITIYALVERIVPAHLLTEGMSWLSTAVGFGVAVGAWAGGRLTDAFGPSDAYLFALGCALLALVTGAVGGALLHLPEGGRSEAGSAAS
ncbi:MFS transporter [Sphaerisporangium rufum]|uniref:MFS transporter n=1 Tax=Sphaerisporangium rufum TaxID=1381558 RepID=A0A919R3F3_9ACTN|nr:MFS transporter [Sphaerisporangium rufum]GII76400.1 MFS transporter [Sphaerisporangium rufum]